MKVNKIYVLLLLPALLLVSTVLAGVVFKQLDVTVTVSEALSTTTVDQSVSAFPGEPETISINVDNAASVPLNVEISFSETSNANGVIYTADMPKTVVASPGSNTFDVTYNIASDSPTGTLETKVSLTRIA